MRASTARLAAIAIALATLAPVSAPAATGDLDIPAWLMRDGVRAVAVEFYATWCKPCMEAVPRWQALHEKYRDQGFRLIVVNTMDPGGACVSVGWNPDQMVCDADGRIGRSLGIGRQLPSAWLWSWRGDLLVRGGDVELVEKQLARVFKDNPRVAVEALGADGKPAAALGVAISSELSMTGRMDVRVGEAELARLRALRKESHDATRKESQRCKLGAEMSPNSLLQARVMGEGKGAKLSAALLSAETGCLLASTFVYYSPDQQMRAVREVVFALMARLRRPPEMPTGLQKPQKARSEGREEGRIGGGDDDWQPEQLDEAVLHLTSTPPGAKVEMDGKPLCPATPCARSVARGAHQFTMSGGPDRQARTQTVEVNSAMRLDWSLGRRYATLYLDSDPPGLPVSLDGKPIGRTPLGPLDTTPGAHTAVIDDPCHHRQSVSVQLAQAEQRAMTLKMRPRLGKVRVTARDPRGKAVAAQVWVDGRPIGLTGEVVEVPGCAAAVQARMGELRSTVALHLRPEGVTPVELVLGGVTHIPVGPPALKPRPQRDAPTQKDYWSGVPFAKAQFSEMRALVRSKHMERNVDEKRALAYAASRALSRLDPPRLLVPEPFYRRSLGKAEAERTLSPVVYKLRATDPWVVVVAPLVTRQVLTDDRIRKLRAMDRLFQGDLEQAWTQTPFEEADLDRVLTHVTSQGGGDANRVLVEAAMGYLQSFDPHSGLMNTAEWNETSARTRNTSFAGIGAILNQSEGRTLIQTPMPGRPAAMAGLRAGDVISHVDGGPLAGLSLAQVVERIRGKAGSTVMLQVIRGSSKTPLRIPVRRANIEVKNVTARRLTPHHPQVGVITVNGFVPGTAAEVERELAGLRAMSGGMQGLVLDLRDNPGGRLDEAQKLADLFLEKGLIFRLDGRDGAPQAPTARPGGAGEKVPLVVLVNAVTAAGAEIVAGAIQGNGRGLILGDRTYGKASVQTLLRPAGRTDYTVKLSLGSFHTPLGPLQGVGVLPDVTVPSTLGETPRLAWREEDFSKLKAAQQPPAASPNEGRADRLSRCVELDRGAERLNAADPNPQIRFDYPLMKAADYLRCWNQAR